MNDRTGRQATGLIARLAALLATALIVSLLVAPAAFAQSDPYGGGQPGGQQQQQGGQQQQAGGGAPGAGQILPITGKDVLLFVITGAALVGTGALALTVARRHSKS
ncbi:MAG TPA: hypothetical protein VE975_02640 [Actinomycetota bacterium]|nr:hypothetical protein [Actinomycetota bacterium]